MTTIVKHCPSRYLPAKGGKLRVGTLSQFRKIENEAVRDEREGMFSIEMHFDGTAQVGLQWLSDVTFGLASVLQIGVGGAFIDGGVSFSNYFGNSTAGVLFCFENVWVVERTSETIRLTGNIHLYFEQVDGFVFCMSKSDGIGSVILDDQYDASWSIPEAHVEPFAARLVEQIADHVYSGKGGILEEPIGPIKAASPWAVPAWKEGDTQNFARRHRPVQYVNKITTVSSSADLSRAQVESYLENAAFLKPDRFSAEQEYRFLFYPVLGRGGKPVLLPNRLEPILLDCEPFLEFIERSG